MKKIYSAPQTRNTKLVMDNVLANLSAYPGSENETLTDGGEFDWGD